MKSFPSFGKIISTTMVLLENTAYFERYMSGIFDNQVNHRIIKRVLKVEYI